MKITKIATTMLLGGVATAVMMGQANALEAQAFVDRIAEVYKTIGYELTFGPATLDGDTITVDGGSVKIVSTPDAPSEADEVRHRTDLFGRHRKCRWQLHGRLADHSRYRHRNCRGARSAT